MTRARDIANLGNNTTNLETLETLGIGGGQTSRVGSSEIACKNANKFFASEIKGSAAASDAFFPFADGIEHLIKAGVKSIIHHPYAEIGATELAQ